MKMSAQPDTASEHPLQELLALYGYTVSESEKKTCPLTTYLPDMTLDKDRITKDSFPAEREEESTANDVTRSVTSNASHLLQHLQGGAKDVSESSSEEDCDASVPPSEEHKEIMVGSMYQAKIPPLGSGTYQDGGCDSVDQLLWTPEVLPAQEVEQFLLKAQRPGGHEGAACTKTHGDSIRDNEQALYELVKCKFNAEEALRRFRFNVKVLSEDLCAWSEEECRNFEHGYRVYGKNFHLIQANKVRTRSVGECVGYYYMWKKSERHDYFTQQATRLGRRKYNQQLEQMEDGEQDGEVDGSNPAHSLPTRTQQPEPSPPPQSTLETDKQGPDGEPVMDRTGQSDLPAMGRLQRIWGPPPPPPPVHGPPAGSWPERLLLLSSGSGSAVGPAPSSVTPPPLPNAPRLGHQLHLQRPIFPQAA